MPEPLTGVEPFTGVKPLVGRGMLVVRRLGVSGGGVRMGRTPWLPFLPAICGNCGKQRDLRVQDNRRIDEVPWTWREDMMSEEY